jgi:hypothetical protein
MHFIILLWPWFQKRAGYHLALGEVCPLSHTNLSVIITSWAFIYHPDTPLLLVFTPFNEAAVRPVVSGMILVYYSAL